MTARVEAERAIADVLLEHRPRTVWEPSNYNDPASGHPIGVACSCDWGVEGGNSDDLHRAHVASVLADLMAERQAKAWDEGHDNGRQWVTLNYSDPLAANPYRPDPKDTRDE